MTQMRWLKYLVSMDSWSACNHTKTVLHHVVPVLAEDILTHKALSSLLKYQIFTTWVELQVLEISKDKRVTPNTSVSGQARTPNMGAVGTHLVFYYYHSDTNKKNSAPSYPVPTLWKMIKIFKVKLKLNGMSQVKLSRIKRKASLSQKWLSNFNCHKQPLKLSSISRTTGEETALPHLLAWCHYALLANSGWEWPLILLLSLLFSH